MASTRPNYSPQVSLSRCLHSLSPGGMDMKVKHTHPSYRSDKERLERLKELKRTCVATLPRPKAVRH